MKQHITVEQLNELSENGKSNLVDWYNENNKLPVFQPIPETDLLLSIGQMIEFLDKNNDTNWEIRLHKPRYDVRTYLSEEEDHGELCDALWGAVEEVLEKI